MLPKKKVKYLLWFAALLSVLALVVAPALADKCTVTLTVNKAGAGTGTVTSDDGGINCGADCEETYGECPTTPGKLMGEQVEVTLRATPDEGSVFSHWSGDCAQRDLKGGTGFDPRDPTDPVIVVYMDEDTSCTANFGLPVGGVMVPVDKLGLLAPWAGLAALASLAALTAAMVRRHKSGLGSRKPQT
jgi:hypothetical protein